MNPVREKKEQLGAKPVESKQEFTRPSKSLVSGFTIVELLVVLGIVGLISSIAIFNHRDVIDAQNLEQLVSEMILTLREAQTNAAGGREFPKNAPPKFRGVVVDKFDVGYGVYFSRDNRRSGVERWNQYIYFGDLNRDSRYNGYGTCGTYSPECLKVVDLKRKRYKIKQSGICLTDVSGETCILNSVNIVFKAGGQEAQIIHWSESRIRYFDQAKIKLISPGGREKTVVVETSGRLYIE